MNLEAITNQFLEYISKVRAYSPHTRLAYQRDLNKLQSVLGPSLSIEALTPRLLRRFLLQEMEKGPSAATQSRLIAC